MATLSEHARTVLTAYANATKPVDYYDVVASLLPPEPQIGWGGSGRQEFRAWLTRRNELMKAAESLMTDGLIATAPDDPEREVITEDGRQALKATS